MAKITRKHQKVFAGSASNNGVFGSAQAGTKVLSSDPDTIQGLAAFDSGWLAAVISGQKLPALEEMQALDFLITRQLSYLFQEGIPEYNASCEYHQNSIVKKTGTYELYGSLINTNVGNALPAAVSDANWRYLGSLTNIGSQKGILSFSSDFTLTSNDIGNLVTFNATSNKVCTLPAPNSVPAGSKFVIMQASNNPYTLTLNTPSGNIGGTLLFPAGTSLVMQAGTQLELISDGSSLWWAVNGSGAALLSANGWSKNQNGLILQWGTYAAASVTFPITFPNAVFVINCTDTDATAGAVSVTSPTTSGFTVNGDTSGFFFAVGY